MKSMVEACFLKNKTGKFFRVLKEKQDRYDQDLNSTTITSMEFQITLDSEEKHHSAKIYGIIDAIGTLGGVHEIVLWCIMLIYGSLRKNVYLFSIINHLIQTEQFQDINSEENNEIKSNDQMSKKASNMIDTQRGTNFNMNRVHNITSIQKSEIKMCQSMF